MPLLVPSEAALCRGSLLSKWNTQLNENWPRAGQRGKLSLPMYSFEEGNEALKRDLVFQCSSGREF